MKKQQKCYIYTRVSTSMQVEGYSLDAQKDKLRKYAEYQEMSIVGEYSDEGKSGKSVEGRPQFKQMLADIESGKDNVDYVLVFKLSRFGRNAADVLSSLQKMQETIFYNPVTHSSTAICLQEKPRITAINPNGLRRRVSESRVIYSPSTKPFRTEMLNYSTAASCH